MKMKKIVGLGLTLALGLSCLTLIPACGDGEVVYSLSDDGSYYIVSGISGSKSAISEYEVSATYQNPETGENLPVKEIGDDAFFMCTSLTDITLPDSIEVIGERAFAYSSICEITLPESLKVISRSAFGSCEKLTEVTIPQSVTTLSSQAFVFCTNLKAVYVKANILDLQAYTFYNSIVTDLNGNTYTNTALTQVYLPATLQKINSTALSGNFITDIYFAGSDEEWKEVYFYNITTADDGTTKEEVQDKDSLLSGVAVHTNYNF